MEKENNPHVVESFTLDHTKVIAPFVRKCSVLKGEMGDKVTKYDLRFCQPNKEEMPSAAMHTLEHLLATHLRESTDSIIDLSPMGCKTGFYLTIWGDQDVAVIISSLNDALSKVTQAKDIPAANEIQCGNFRLHDLDGAIEIARKILNKDIKSLL